MTSRTIAIPLHDFNAGGTEATAFRLAAEWIALGHRVVVVAGADEGPMRARVPAGAEVRLLAPAMQRSATSRLRLGRAMVPVLQEIAPDIVYIIGNFHFLLARALRRQLPAPAIVAKISNPLLPDVPAGARRFATRLLRMMTDPIDLFVAMSPELAERDRLLLPTRPIRIAPEPNLPRDYTPPARIGPADPPLIVAIGRMEPQKNLALALHAFAALRATWAARLAILGDGSERAALEALAHTLGITADVDMPGFVPDVSPWLARASLLLLTSQFEGFPAVAVEALAADVPVVATDCSPVLPRLLPTPLHGEVAAEPTAATIAGAMNRTLAAPFTSGGVRHAIVGGYTARAAAQEYLAIFEEAIAARHLCCR